MSSNIRKLQFVWFCWKLSWMAAFSLLSEHIPLLLPGAPRAFISFNWFTFSSTLTFVFCQSVPLNVQLHQDMLPGAKVKDFETHYKLKLWASRRQEKEHVHVKTCWSASAFWQPWHYQFPFYCSVSQESFLICCSDTLCCHLAILQHYNYNKGRTVLFLWAVIAHSGWLTGDEKCKNTRCHQKHIWNWVASLTIIYFVFMVKKKKFKIPLTSPYFTPE